MLITATCKHKQYNEPSCSEETKQCISRPASRLYLVRCAITTQYLVLQQLQLAAQLVPLLCSSRSLGLFLLQSCLQLACLHFMLWMTYVSSSKDEQNRYQKTCVQQHQHNNC